MTNLEQRLAALTPEARRKLLLRAQQKKGKSAQIQKRPQTSDTNGLPLSFAQQRLWFLSKLDPQSGAYNMPAVIHFSGSLDSAALERSFNTIMQRHEILRTSFSEQDGEPRQNIASVTHFHIPVIDLRTLASVEEQVNLLAQQELQRPFDLTQGPLLRIYLLQIDTDEHILLFTMHHIVSDGWSIGVVMQELSIIYQAETQGKEPLLPVLPIQYADYVLWQRSVLQGEALERQLDYWRQQLANAPTVLDIPTDRPRSPRQTFIGTRKSLLLPTDLVQALTALSQREDATLFMTLLAAFQVLLMRYSGQQDMVIGTPIANRLRQELEGLIGMFVNTLALRTDLSGNPGFRQLLARVRDVTLEAYAHQDLPFEKLVDSLQIERSLSTPPLFQVMFVLQNTPQNVISLGHLHWHIVDQGATTAKFDLTVQNVETADGLLTTIEYNTDLFDDTTIERMLAHWQMLLQSIVQNADQTIEALPLLPDAERKQLLVTGNKTAIAEPPARCLSQLVEQQVKQTPEAIALVFEEDQMTYEELNRRANQLAHHLRTLGVGPDVLVGICMERSLEVLIGLLAILKAGGAYMPLDPSYPAERLSFIAHQAQISFLLTQPSLLTRLPVQTFPSGLTTIHLNTSFFTHEIAQQPTDNPVSSIQPDNLAYIMYTSGSTGQPKGVALSHRALLNLFNWQANDMPLEAGTRVLQFAPLSFDASCEELFTTWQQGGTIVGLPSDELRRDPKATLDLMEKQHIARIYVPYVALQQFATVASQRPARTLSLQAVITAGEQLQITPAIIDWFQQLPQCRLYNYYGPSESHVVTAYLLQGEPQSWPALPAIGYPIANTQIYLLDAHYQPVPIGITGELYIGGISLARGYLQRPDLTAERFVPDPFATEAGARLYQTGDLARYRADGSIEFLGRRDHQVKLRGFRIELGEIEALLQEHATIKDAVVLLHESQVATGQQRYLVAYVVIGEAELPTAHRLQQYLQQYLPDYMIPAHFIVLDALPLTPSGKVDRRALPAPDEQTMLHQQEQFVPPSTPHQELIAQIWKNLLSLPQVSIHDNFFALGGHSLLATQVQARIRQTFGAEITVRDLFEAPTIATLAQRIEQRLHEERHQTMPTLVPLARPETIPLSFAQERLWFLQQLEPSSTAYHLPAALRLQGPFQMKALEQSLQNLLSRHEVLRTTFAIADGRPIQAITSSGMIQIPLIDLRGIKANTREHITQQLVQQEAQALFDLINGPLLRVRIVRLDAQTHVMLVTMHHIISDGWSISVLIRELSALYHAAVSGETLSLPALPIQYADFALWQRSWLQEETVAQHLSYWREQLAGAPALLKLPTDRPRPAQQTFAGAHTSLLLPVELLHALTDLSQREGVTLFMTVLTAFQILLMRYSRQEDIVVGTPIANRPIQELESLVGMFVNTLVLRTDLSGDPAFRQALARVRHMTLEAYAHQDLPFEKLVDGLQVERSLSYPPLFQVMFILQNTPQETIMLDNLSWHPNPFEHSEINAKFDLTLELQERSDGLLTTIEYNTDLFDATTIERMLTHWQTLLQSCVAQPEQHISTLNLLTPMETTRLLNTHPQTDSDRYTETTLPQLFEQQVEQTPDAIAVLFGEHHLTYQELNHRANLVASYLQARGVVPEVKVGLCMQRSTFMLIALLGILKAGGAYVPIDPSYPCERMAFLLDDSQVTLVITEQTVIAHLPTGDRRLLISLDQEWNTIETETKQSIQSNAYSQNLAYIIYTSGSTGCPKGVSGMHRGIINRLHGTQQTMPFNSDERCCQKTNLSFIDSVAEIFGPLTQGVPLVILPDETVLDPQRFREQLEQQAISRIVLVPSLLQVLLQAPDDILRQQLQRLRYWTCSGETLPLTVIQRLHETLPAAQLYNFYGSSEVAADATSHHITDEEGYAHVAIGRPFIGVRTYVLDAAQQLVPYGVVGEIYIGGSGLARGYWQQASLTAERFVPDALSGSAGARLYRTGDLGRYREDGTLEYIGRADEQVKLRGFRIELGEIEATIRQQADIQDALVVLHNGTEEQTFLLAYLVPQGEVTLQITDIEAGLRVHLPDYMIPRSFMLLETFPLTPNGKLDRQALPLPDEQSIVRQQEQFVAPSTLIQEKIAAIWRDLLKLSQLGIHDNFFALGGHSLLVTQVQSRIRNTFQVELSVRDLFVAPTVASLAQRIEDVQHETQRENRPVLRPMMRLMHRENISLSSAQERLWFLHQLEPASAAYHLPTALRLQGPFHLQAFEQSLHTLLQRHESLRTTFALSNGQPIQVIAPSSSIKVPIINLRHLEYALQEHATQQLVHQEAQAPFNLTTGPLLRVAVVCLDVQTHVLLVTMHHIIADGWSMSVLVRELSTLYHAEVSQTPISLPSLPIQYADYAHWQRQWLQGEVLEQQLNYWRKQLEGLPPLLDLPTDWARPAIQSYHGAQLKRVLSVELLSQLKKLSQSEDVTLFMTLLASFQALLSRFSKQEDIVVGTPIANRRQPELESLIGMFVNTLVLRTDLSDHPDFRQLLRRVREMTLQAYAHQDLPFEQLVDALQTERNLSYSPLFQVSFTLQNTPDTMLELDDLSWHSVVIKQTTAQFDLGLTVTESDAGLHVAMLYNTDLFAHSTIERMLDSWQTLMEAIVHDPDQSITRLPLLTEQASQQLLTQWNKTTSNEHSTQGLHHLVERHAELTPDAIAVVCEQASLTYQALNAKANQIAHKLQATGVGPDVLVGVCLERSLEQIIALLAVLKAGGAYVPLDPGYPEERLAFMLDDAQPALLLTHTNIVTTLPALSLPIVCLDTVWENLDQELSTNPVTTFESEQLAYMIYTSGSTGRPKGTLLTHANVIRLLARTDDWFHFQPEDVWTFFHSFAFDFSVWEIWGALCSGARLIVVSYAVSRAPAELFQLLLAEQVTILNQTPSAFRQLMQSEALQPASRSLALRLVIFGGEALQIESLRPWFARYGDQRPQLVNMYGITETTVHVTYRPLALADLKRGQNSVIGLPIPDLQCYVLDELGQPVPIGVAGELYVGGLGLARGYWQRGDITAERFLPHPFSDTPGARLYRTGDLVRYSIAGELEYLGRVDQQVKLRGFRIELGEIEAALNQHAMIRENVVIIGEDQAGDKCLIAYLVTHDRENQPAIKTLRLFLQNQLPAYMVPSHFVFLDKLPLTANKKIDRRALPAPMGSQHELDTEYVAPRNEIEQTLAAIWQEVLGVEQIGIHDNFFERGGNSLVSMQILMKTHLAGIDVNLKQYFQYQTIAELAEKIASERDKEHEQTDIVIVQAEQGLVTGPLPFTSGQRWLLHEKETSNSHLNSVYTLDVQRPLNFAILNQTLQILQRHHDMLRLRLTRDETGWRQTIIEAMDSLPYIRFDFSHLTPAEQKRAVNTISSQLHIDLNHFEGSFLRMAYFDFGPQRPAQLFLIINHFVTDHTSSFILLQDFQTVYQQIEEERAISLPPKTVSFQHWARRVDEYLHSEELRHELEHYWLALPWGDVPPLPIDYPEGMAKNTLSLSRLVKMSLSTEETSLLQQCLNNDIQILDILLGALAYTLSKWIESPIMSVLAQYHGRQNVFDGFDLSRTFGYVAFGRYLFFDMNEATTVIEAFQQTREQLHHLPHQGIGLDMLMQLGNEEIKEKLKKVRHPEVVFNFTGIALQASGPSLFLPAQETPDETTKTDVYRNYKLHCGGEIVDGQLWITWEYGSKIHKRTTIETLGQTYMQTLKKLIAYLSGKE